MSIRELQARKSAARAEYERICEECDAEILAIRRKRDPNYDKKQQEKLNASYANYPVYNQWDTRSNY